MGGAGSVLAARVDCVSLPLDLLAGRYRILSPLGAGGMGEVFLAEDTRLERRVAVKMLPASIEADAVARERLRREALAAAALDHYLGDIELALEHWAMSIKEQPPTDHAYQGMSEANLFAATALAGHHDRARALMPALVPWLPVSGRRNVIGAFLALDACVTGLALVGDRGQCGALYPLTLDYIHTGLVVSDSVGPSNPQLAAAMAADAAGLVDQSREHFETALRQARDVPIRILQPTVLYWYGRSLSTVADSADRLRGRAMVEAALVDFRSLEMVLHANLAEQFLRAGGPSQPQI